MAFMESGFFILMQLLLPLSCLYLSVQTHQKKLPVYQSSWLWRTLEAIPILQQERACPNKLDFHPLFFSPLTS